MSLYTRSLMAVVLLGAALAAQSGLWWHVTAAGPLPEVALERALNETLPLELGDWQGQDVEISDTSLYGDDHLKRVYVHRPTGQQVTLWIAYSKDGKDRGHHPEICLAVLGQSEDKSAQGAIEVPGHAAPIQQFRYGRPGQSQWIYYWHYTLKAEKGPETTELQRIYQRSQRRFSSITLEVFAPHVHPTTRDLAVEFVTLVDTTFQNHLPKTAIRGSNRTPVRRIQAD